LDQVLAQATARGALPEPLWSALSFAATAVSILGAVVILWGVLSSMARWVPIEWREIRGDPKSIEYENKLRRRMGFHLLMGLELLVAADIIGTIIAPTMEHLITLGVIVVIRIVVGATLHWEVSQRQEVKKEQEAETATE
jgi:uncharacterized membrane protein